MTTIIRFSEKLISRPNLPQEDPKFTWDGYPLRNRKEVVESRPRWSKGISLKHWTMQFDELKVPMTILKLHPRSSRPSKQISTVKYKEGHLDAPSNQRKCFKARSALNLTPHERKTAKDRWYRPSTSNSSLKVNCLGMSLFIWYRLNTSLGLRYDSSTLYAWLHIWYRLDTSIRFWYDLNAPPTWLHIRYKLKHLWD